MQRFVPRGPLGQLVADNRDRLLAAAELWNAHDVRLFGSLARGEDTADSDVDLLVAFNDQARPLDVVSLTCDAEEILGVRVDVGTVESLRPDVRDDALNDAVLL
jgi:predicted nucleotidyltransferase